ncbi:hypothetical protein JXB41_06820 [Candidatus Woesearchaeota archaeon]|nr:hypothetical protein [Candidatus Woesearchaeota archaeon]
MKKKLTDKLIKEITSELIGEDAVPLVLYLKDKTKVSEFDISKAIKRDIHETRTLLYKLFENNIASFIRRKDKKKGWYVCYWDIEPEKIKYQHEKLKKDKISSLNQRLEKEKASEFYMCRNACTRIDFDKAFGLNFKCPECGSLLNPVDNKRTIEFLGERIKELKTEIGMET